MKYDNSNIRRNALWFHVLFLCLVLSSRSYSQTILATYEAEKALCDPAILIDTTVNKQIIFANMKQTGFVEFTINMAKRGTYGLTLRVRSSGGIKKQNLEVKGIFNQKLEFPQNNGFYDHKATAIQLKAGNNKLRVAADWGYMHFDKIFITTVPRVDYSLVTPSLINLNATQKTKDLYAFLRSQYGKNVISGQTAAWWDTVNTITGKIPLLQSWDLWKYTAGYPCKWANSQCTTGWVDDGTTASAMKSYRDTKGKVILTLHWHWHSPFGGLLNYSTFDSDKTTFDVSKAVMSGTPENRAVIRDIDSIASQLKKLQRANIPILFRPLHEADGGWFWWGKMGSGPALALYDILYDRITNHHKINNLIWVWSSHKKEWYPGNDKVDILGIDPHISTYAEKYPYDTRKSFFDEMYDIVQGQKLLAMTENGPVPDAQGMFDEDAVWSYFLSWSDFVYKQNSASHLRSVFSHPNVLTLNSPLITSNEIEETVPSIQIHAFPNPSKFGSTVSLTKPETIKSILITDMLGREERFENPTFTTTLKGLLVLRMLTTNGEQSIKLYVE